jgi:hypothetical protein
MRERVEVVEYEALRERNRRDRKMLLELRERERHKEELEKMGIKYEMWRLTPEVQREARNAYERERRQKRKEALEQSNGNGDL